MKHRNLRSIIKSFAGCRGWAAPTAVKGFSKEPLPAGGTIKKLFKRLLIAAVFLGVVYCSVPLREPLFESDYSAVVLDEEGNILRAFLNKDQQWYFPPEMEREVPEKLKTCILQFEDRYFYRHPGVNPLAMIRALGQLLKSGSVKSGASTITMQVVRLSYKRKRNLAGKMMEILQALKLETRYSKEEILKMYVNHAPYGGNIIGYYAASLKYFGKKPRALTWGEAATLAILPNAPGTVSPGMNRDRLLRKRDRLLKRMMDREIIDDDTYRLSTGEPIPRTLTPFFGQAPHLAGELVNRDEGTRRRLVTRTTIRRQHQQRVETLVKNHMEYLKGIGVENGAALVVETGSGKVRAYVGSQDFFDAEGQGQVNGVQAQRSTGSTLKPFLYALAMDEGIVLPQTLIKDIPSYFGSFSPSNADKKYSGVVTAGNALNRSLNIPAVRLLNAYGLRNFYVFLKAAGMTTLFRTPEEYGLTLVLGGAEATLFDMATLYRGLGNGGQFGLLQMVYEDNRRSNPKEKTNPLKYAGRQLISPGACYLTLEMLKNVKRPGAEYYWEQYRDRHPIAWKTGTSYGQRDAWAVGVTPEWTIAVWVGNFSGEGNSNLSGAKSAAPLMFDIFNYLPKSKENHWFRKPGYDLKMVRVCLDTGFAAGPFCEKTRAVPAPGGAPSLKQCPYHKHFYTDKKGNHEVCSLCWEPGNYKKVSRLVYPPDVSQYLRENGVVLSRIPRHKTACTGASVAKNRKPIQVIYPVQNARLWIPRDFDGKLQAVTFRVAHRDRGKNVYWYIDDIYQGTTTNLHKKLLRLTDGQHRLEVIDQSGNRAQRKFQISYVK